MSFRKMECGSGRALALADLSLKLGRIAPVVVKRRVLFVGWKLSEFRQLLFQTLFAYSNQEVAQFFGALFVFLVDGDQLFHRLRHAAGRKRDHGKAEPGLTLLRGTADEQLVMRNLVVANFAVSPVEAERPDVVLAAGVR